MLNVVHELSSLYGISGRENEVRQYILEQLKDAPAIREIRVDRMGNILVDLRGKQAAPHRVMFAAHMDEVGGMVTGITEDGYLRFATIGISAEVLFARRVIINGHIGVIGGKAVHQCKGDEKTTVPSTDAMYIDIGAMSREEAEQVVRIGDAICFIDGITTLGNGRFLEKALDDRAGCAVLMKLAQTQPQYDVTIVFTVQEECGVRGAGCAAFAVKPEIAVAVDVTTAGDIVDVAAEDQVCCIGDGPVVSFMDRGTIYDKPLFEEIFRIARKHDISAQVKRAVTGGNDSRAMQTTGEGARVAAVSLPCRYLHSAVCMLDEKDITETYRLLEQLMNTLPAWDGAL